MTAQTESTGEVFAAPVPPAEKRAISWTERYRATTLEVERYSRFVLIMKRALPMAAIALLAAVVAYSLQPRLPNGKKLAFTLQSIGILTNDLMMIKPRLTGVDGDGNPYVVTAAEAIQDLHNTKRAQLKRVEADMTLKSGEWLNMTATRGWFDATLQKLWLRGVIDVYSDNGYEAHTTAADIDMRTGSIVGNSAVNGLGPMGTFRSDRFRIDRSTMRNSKHLAKQVGKNDPTRIYLYGHVQMTIYKQHKAAHA